MPATNRLKWTGGTDIKDFKLLARSLRRTQFVVYERLMRNLRVGADKIAEDARQISGEFSTRIPGTIKVRQTALQITIFAGNASAPHARLFEVGNRGRRGANRAATNGTFAHPVFGGPNWVEQPMHPFLVPAGAQNKEKLDALVIEAFDEALGWAAGASNVTVVF